MNNVAGLLPPARMNSRDFSSGDFRCSLLAALRSLNGEDSRSVHRVLRRSDGREYALKKVRSLLCCRSNINRSVRGCIKKNIPRGTVNRQRIYTLRRLRFSARVALLRREKPPEPSGTSFRGETAAAVREGEGQCAERSAPPRVRQDALLSLRGKRPFMAERSCVR